MNLSPHSSVMTSDSDRSELSWLRLARSWINFCQPMRLSLPAAVLVVLALGEPAAQVFKVDTELVTIPITVTP